ncbi:MAG: hypothetical protein NW226_17595 [Microscillaceae bacterium]|nr:hypothetical protein [Microscillaceae bacterium]
MSTNIILIFLRKHATNFYVPAGIALILFYLSYWGLGMAFVLYAGFLKAMENRLKRKALKKEVAELFGQEYLDKISLGEVWVGMPEKYLKLALGSPAKREISENKNHRRITNLYRPYKPIGARIWHYRIKVVLDDGKVISLKRE